MELVCSIPYPITCLLYTSFHIIVAYGVSISAVTENLISNVKYKVEEFSGMPVDKINIYIEGVLSLIHI